MASNFDDTPTKSKKYNIYLNRPIILQELELSLDVAAIFFNGFASSGLVRRISSDDAIGFSSDSSIIFLYFDPRTLSGTASRIY